MTKIEEIEVDSFDELRSFATKTIKHTNENPIVFSSINLSKIPEILTEKGLNHLVKYAGLIITVVLTYDNKEMMWHLSLSSQAHKLSDELCNQFCILLLPSGFKEIKSPFNHSPVRHFIFKET